MQITDNPNHLESRDIILTTHASINAIPQTPPFDPLLQPLYLLFKIIVGKMKIQGGCYCTAIRYEITLDSPDEARMSICHCPNCKKFTGTENGITAKIPRSAIKLTQVLSRSISLPLSLYPRLPLSCSSTPLPPTPFPPLFSSEV